MRKNIEWFLKNRELLKQVYGKKFVVIQDQKSHAGFADILDALRFRDDKWPDSEINVLIRHTGHVDRITMCPSVFGVAK